MKTYFIFFICLLGCISCAKRNRCDDPIIPSLSIDFKDKLTGRYLYEEFNPLYNKDSLKAFDVNGNPVYFFSSLNTIPGSALKYWRVELYNIYDSRTDANAFNSEICKNYVFRYKFSETDTIKVCFKIKSLTCSFIFETLTIYNKGQLLVNKSNAVITGVTITKN